MQGLPRCFLTGRRARRRRLWLPLCTCLPALPSSPALTLRAASVCCQRALYTVPKWPWPSTWRATREGNSCCAVTRGPSDSSGLRLNTRWWWSEDTRGERSMLVTLLGAGGSGGVEMVQPFDCVQADGRLCMF